MASKLPTAEIRPKGKGPVSNTSLVTRGTVLSDINSALQEYFGTRAIVTMFVVSDDDEGKTVPNGTNDKLKDEDAVVVGEMETLVRKEPNKPTKVVPDLTGTKLVYESAVDMFCRLYIVTMTDSTQTRFLYAWHRMGENGWQWLIGSPYLIGPGGSGNAVGFTRKNITSKVVKLRPVKAIKNSFGRMVYGVATR